MGPGGAGGGPPAGSPRPRESVSQEQLDQMPSFTCECGRRYHLRDGVDAVTVLGAVPMEQPPRPTQYPDLLPPPVLGWRARLCRWFAFGTDGAQ